MTSAPSHHHQCTAPAAYGPYDSGSDDDDGAGAVGGGAAGGGSGCSAAVTPLPSRAGAHFYPQQNVAFPSAAAAFMVPPRPVVGHRTRLGEAEVARRLCRRCWRMGYRLRRRCAGCGACRATRRVVMERRSATILMVRTKKIMMMIVCVVYKKNRCFHSTFFMNNGKLLPFKS